MNLTDKSGGENGQDRRINLFVQKLEDGRSLIGGWVGQ